MSRRLAALLVTVCAAAAGCGLSTNASPETLSRENLPEDLGGRPDATGQADEVPTGEAEEAELWFVTSGEDGEVLVPVTARVVAGASEAVVLDSLFAYPNDRLNDQGMRSAIPREGVFAEAEVEGRELVVDLHDRFYTGLAEGDGRLAFGQIVLTVTDNFPVDSVRFLREGNPEVVTDADGSEVAGPVERSDYARLIEVEPDGRFSID